MRSRPDSEFLTLEAAADWYEIGKSTLRRLVSDGQLTKHVRSGDKRMWLKVEELERELRPRPASPDAP